MIMYSGKQNFKKGHTMSPCTINELRKAFFENKTTKLKPEYNCLLRDNANKNLISNHKDNGMHAWQDLAEKNLPGYYYSLNDQCRMSKFDKGSYVTNYKKLYQNVSECKIKCSDG